MVVSFVTLPCAVMRGFTAARVPPTFWLLTFVPTAIAASATNMRGIGTESRSSRVITVVRWAFCTSTVGACPVTVIDSSTAPI